MSGRVETTSRVRGYVHTEHLADIRRRVPTGQRLILSRGTRLWHGTLLVPGAQPTTAHGLDLDELVGVLLDG